MESSVPNPASTLTSNPPKKSRPFHFSWVFVLSAAAIALLIGFLALVPPRPRFGPMPTGIAEPERQAPTRRLDFTSLHPEPETPVNAVIRA